MMAGGYPMLPIVSIVVPVYKVEKYLNLCIESIIHQTYTHLEIILVNDGSPDACGEMIDRFAEIDNRIIALHKENGGLSDARNFGMQFITGEYTLFVDSDDWLESTMIEKLVASSMNLKADIVQAGFYYAHDDYLLFDTNQHSKNDAPSILDNAELMSELVKNEKVKNFAWGKLYKTVIIKDILFEKGVLFEDVFWAHQVMHKVSRYVLLHEPLYYYRQRNDSIVATYSVKNLDIIKGLMTRHVFIEQYYKELVNESYRGILKTSLMHYNLLLSNRKKDKEGYNRKGIQIYIKQNYSRLKKAVERDKDLKRQLILFRIHPYFNVFFLFAGKVLRKAKLTSQKVNLQRINLN